MNTTRFTQICSILLLASAMPGRIAGALQVESPVTCTRWIDSIASLNEQTKVPTSVVACESVASRALQELSTECLSTRNTKSVSGNVLHLQRKTCALSALLMYTAATRQIASASGTDEELKGLVNKILAAVKPVDSLLRAQTDTTHNQTVLAALALSNIDTQLARANDSLGRIKTAVGHIDVALVHGNRALDSIVTLLSRTCPPTTVANSQACIMLPPPRPKLRLLWGLIEWR